MKNKTKQYGILCYVCLQLYGIIDMNIDLILRTDGFIITVNQLIFHNNVYPLKI